MLREQSFRDFTPIVVDAGSSDDTADSIRNGYPEVVLLTESDNLWWTAATNAGVQWALEHGSQTDIVLTLNNDTVMDGDYLQRVADGSQARPEALIGSLVVSDKDCRTVVDGGMRLSWLTARYTVLARGENAERVRASGLVEADTVCGCGTLVPLSVYRRIGLYSADRLPHYAADYELAIRARRNGVPVLVNYDAQIVGLSDETGTHATAPNAPLVDFLRSFWDVRSANGLRQRWAFTRLACPWYVRPSFLAIDTGRVVGGAIRRRYLAKQES